MTHAPMLRVFGPSAPTGPPDCFMGNIQQAPVTWNSMQLLGHFPWHRASQWTSGCVGMAHGQKLSSSIAIVFSSIVYDNMVVWTVLFVGYNSWERFQRWQCRRAAGCRQRDTAQRLVSDQGQRPQVMAVHGPNCLQLMAAFRECRAEQHEGLYYHLVTTR